MLKNPEKKSIAFVKPGEKAKINKSFQQESFLSSADDWKMSVDLEQRMKIPGRVAVTDLIYNHIVGKNKADDDN